MDRRAWTPHVAAACCIARTMAALSVSLPRIIQYIYIYIYILWEAVSRGDGRVERLPAPPARRFKKHFKPLGRPARALPHEPPRFPHGVSRPASPRRRLGCFHPSRMSPRRRLGCLHGGDSDVTRKSRIRTASRGPASPRRRRRRRGGAREPDPATACGRQQGFPAAGRREPPPFLQCLEARISAAAAWMAAWRGVSVEPVLPAVQWGRSASPKTPAQYVRVSETGGGQGPAGAPRCVPASYSRPQ